MNCLESTHSQDTSQECLEEKVCELERTYSHHRFAAEILRDSRRRPTAKDDKARKITLNARNDGARSSSTSVIVESVLE